MDPFKSQRIFEAHGPKEQPGDSYFDGTEFRAFEASEEGKEFRRLQKSETDATLADHQAFKEKRGHTWSPEVTASHDRIANQLKRGLIGAPDALGAFVRLHGDNHPLYRSYYNLGPQFK